MDGALTDGICRRGREGGTNWDWPRGLFRKMSDGEEERRTNKGCYTVSFKLQDKLVKT